MDPENPTPDRSSAKYKALAWGEDSITLTPTQYGESTTGYFYISVYGWSNTTFSILASFESSTISPFPCPRQSSHLP
jgi:hypothetical protein